MSSPETVPWRPPAKWVKASASNPSNNCLYLGPVPGGRVGIINSELGPDSPLLTCTPADLAAFIDGAASGEFNHLID